MRIILFALATLVILTASVYAELPKDIVFLMTFDEGKGDAVKDLSGNLALLGNDGKVDGKADWINGKYGGAFHFDGSTAITVKNADPLKKLSDPMSAGAWINPDLLGGWRNIVEMDGATGWKFGFADPNVLVWTTYRVKDFIGQTPIAEKKWTYVAATWDGKEAKLYINGEDDKGGPIAGGGKINVSGEPSLDIGFRSTSRSSYFQGGMDELWVSNKVKTKKEIQELMNGFDALLAVQPQDKLTTTWGKIKMDR